DGNVRPADGPGAAELIEEFFEFEFRKKARRAAAECRLRDVFWRNGCGDRMGLALNRSERSIHEAGAGLDGGEQIAATGAHFAERQMHIEKQIAFVFVLPRVGQRNGRIERTIRGLVRIRVGVAVVATFCHALRQGALHNMKSAYGTVHTTSWPSRCP